MQKAARWPCGVCGRDGNNATQCTSCHKWVHKKCSGIKGSMSKVMKFICRSCVNPVTSTSRTRVDIGVIVNLELVDKFCLLGDMLSIDGDIDAAGRQEFELYGINSGSWYKDVSLIVNGRLYSSCV